MAGLTWLSHGLPGSAVLHHKDWGPLLQLYIHEARTNESQTRCTAHYCSAKVRAQQLPGLHLKLICFCPSPARTLHNQGATLGSETDLLSRKRWACKATWHIRDWPGQSFWLVRRIDPGGGRRDTHTHKNITACLQDHLSPCRGWAAKRSVHTWNHCQASRAPPRLTGPVAWPRVVYHCCGQSASSHPSISTRLRRQEDGGRRDEFFTP